MTIDQIYFKKTDSAVNFKDSEGRELIDALENRVDNLMTIPEGGTSADAALNDIKVGADGTVYNTPGEAVRIQIRNTANNAATLIAEAFDDTKSYSAGEHVTYNGGLHVFTTDHAAGAWSASEVTQIVVDDELSDLKNAINENTISFISQANKGIDLSNSGALIDYNNYTASDYIPIGDYMLEVDTDVAISGTSALYDANQTYLRGISFPVGKTELTRTDGYYLIFSCPTASFGDVKIRRLRLDKTLSVENAGAESATTGRLRDTVYDYQHNVMLNKNLIESVTSGYYLSNSSAGRKVAFSSNASYGYAKVYVEAGAKYTLNNSNYSNSFSVVVDAYDTIIGLLSSYAGTNPTVYTMPSNADYVVLCAQQLGASGDKNVVMMLGESVITDVSVYNTTNYPFGIVKDVFVKNLNEASLNGLVPKPPFINSNSYQYIDVDKWESGTYWSASENNSVVKSQNASYYSYPAFELKAGSYNIVNVSGSFSFAVYKTSGTRKQFSSIWSAGTAYRPIGYTLTLEEDATIYLSNSNSVSLSMVSTGELLMNTANTQPVYVLGEYNKSAQHIYYCGHTRPLNTLRKAIEEATKYFDSIVYVDNETFDLAEEFADVLPTIDGTNQREGITLKNRVHVIFASGSKVIFDYSGDNEYVYTCFSPFNGGEHGFTLENAWVESTNCRYSVHDELNASAIPYHNVYKRCTFIHDSSESSWGAHQAIGGGLGRFGDILIKDCYASSVGAHSANLPVISYHNAGVSAVAKSNINIHNTYVADGSIRVTNQGANTVKSRAMISGCNVYGVEPYYEKTISADRADNMELFQWNNVVRTE